MKNNVKKELLEKYLDGNCTPEEEQIVLLWLESGSNEQVLKDMENDWLMLEEDDYRDTAFEPEFAGLQSKINPKLKVRKLAPWMKVAASLIFIMISAFIILFYIHTTKDAFITKHTEKGYPSVVTLDDGSKVTLSAGSTISYPVKFANNRQVHLEGEAYFDVSGSEITIYAGNVATKATHSSLNVAAFPEDKEVVVSVTEGRAEIKKDQPSSSPLMKLRLPESIPLTKLVPAVVIKNNEFLAYNKEDSTISKGEDFDIKEVSAWMDGTIYFNNADSSKVLKKLERWYGVNIEVNGCLGQKFFNGEFNNKSIEEVIMRITTNESSKLKYKRVGDRIFINGTCI